MTQNSGFGSFWVSILTCWGDMCQVPRCHQIQARKQAKTPVLAGVLVHMGFYRGFNPSLGTPGAH